MSAVDLAVKILKKDELDGEYSDKPYYDSKQIPTISYGFVVGKRYAPLPTFTMSQQEGEKKLIALTKSNEKTMLNNPDLFAAYKNCNDVQKSVLLSMAHQIGIYGLTKFTGMLGCLYQKDFASAAKECLDSKAAREDAPDRFKRNAWMLRTGELHEYYRA